MAHEGKSAAPLRENPSSKATLDGNTEFARAFKSEGWSKRPLQSTAVLGWVTQSRLRRQNCETTDQCKSTLSPTCPRPLVTAET